MAQKLERRLGKPFVIENRPGGGTTLAAGAGRARQPRRLHADAGHQHDHGDQRHASRRSCAYDPVKDFAPVALLTASPFVLTVSADSPVKSVADLIALAKAKPGELNYG